MDDLSPMHAAVVDRVFKWREASKDGVRYTIGDFADAAGISRSYLYSMFRGRRPSVYLMAKVARALGVSQRRLKVLLDETEAWNGNG